MTERIAGLTIVMGPGRKNFLTDAGKTREIGQIGVRLQFVLWLIHFRQIERQANAWRLMI